MIHQQLDVKEEWIDKIIKVKRVTKVVKGGKRLKISASIVVGNGNGYVGVAHAKANEVVPAINKAKEKARKSAVKVVVGRTIPHEITAKFSATRILLKPASPGTGIIACSSVRNVLECVGYKDVLTKSFGSRNPYNLAVATIKALLQLRSIKDIARERNKPVNYFVEKKKEEGLEDVKQDINEFTEGSKEKSNEDTEESVNKENNEIAVKEDIQISKEDSKKTGKESSEESGTKEENSEKDGEEDRRDTNKPNQDTERSGEESGKIKENSGSNKEGKENKD